MQTLKGKMTVEEGDELESSTVPGTFGDVVEMVNGVMTVVWDAGSTVRVKYHGVASTGRVLWSELPVLASDEVNNDEPPRRWDWRR